MVGFVVADCVLVDNSVVDDVLGDDPCDHFGRYLDVSDLILTGLIDLNDRLKTANADAACLGNDNVLKRTLRP